MENICKIVIIITQIAAALIFYGGCAPEALQAAGLGSSLVNHLSPTIYFIKVMNLNLEKCDQKKTIYDVDQKPLMQVCPANYKLCVVEGTCALIKDDEIPVKNEWVNSNTTHRIDLINYVKLKNGIPLFENVDTKRCPYGYGVKAICLDPFYTVAADLDFHNPGDVIFVPNAVGVELANGERHDGYFIVRDRGGAIKGAHRFDFFTGFLDYRNDKNPFTKLGFHDKNLKVEFRKVSGIEAESTRKRRHFPLTPLSQWD